MSETADLRLGLRHGSFIDVGPADLEENELRAIELEGRFLLLCKSGGRICAVDDMCNHAGCLLSGGWVDPRKRSVVCPCHEVEFELATGRNLTVPRLCEDQQAFPVQLEGGRVLVQLGGRNGE